MNSRSSIFNYYHKKFEELWQEMEEKLCREGLAGDCNCYRLLSAGSVIKCESLNPPICADCHKPIKQFHPC